MTDAPDPTLPPTPTDAPDMRLTTRQRMATVAERAETGRLCRGRRARTSIATLVLAPDRTDPVQLLAAQEGIRVQALLPLRHSRMSVSPFTFYRGSAVIMTSDLAAMPSSGLITQLCGDAHLSNFGMFAAPDRQVVFDINDFDETNPGPFEWDVLRLSTSFVLAGRDNGLDEEAVRNAATASAFAYRTQMAVYAQMSDLEVWYDRVSVEVLEQWASEAGRTEVAQKTIQKSESRARSRDAWSAISKMTEVVDGERRFKNQPPVLMRIDTDAEVFDRVSDILEEYQQTLPRDRQQLLHRYQVIDFGHKVVGVGSVGLLAFVVLLQGRDESDLLVLQVKEAVQSVLEPFTEASAFAESGERVVVGQQFMQAASDVFLGWITGPRGRNFYVRQLRDMKYSPDPATLNDSSLIAYAMVCGRTLARAHARAGDAVAISAYLGTSSKFDRAVRDFSHLYADQVALDFAVYQAAIASGDVQLAKPGEAENYMISVTSSDGVTVTAPGEPTPTSS
jgi:uncharacterized protein (DUF2252 family)